MGILDRYTQNRQDDPNGKWRCDQVNPVTAIGRLEVVKHITDDGPSEIAPTSNVLWCEDAADQPA